MVKLQLKQWNKSYYSKASVRPYLMNSTTDFIVAAAWSKIPRRGKTEENFNRNKKLASSKEFRAWSPLPPH